jgi:ATP-dependent protease ClpP protease subunit
MGSGTVHHVRLHGLVGSFPQSQWDKLIVAIKDLEENPESTLRISLDSGGGIPSTAFSIYDWVQPIKDRVTITVDGVAKSAAATILLSASKRIGRLNSKVMIHAARCQVPGLYETITSPYLVSQSIHGCNVSMVGLVDIAAIVSHLDSIARGLQETETRTTEILSLNTNLPKYVINGRFDRQIDFDAKDALAAGFFTSIEDK